MTKDFDKSLQVKSNLRIFSKKYIIGELILIYFDLLEY